MRAVRSGLAVLLAISVCGCVTYPRQALDKKSMSGVKRIAILPVSENPAEYRINMLKHPAGLFGALGGLALASELQQKSATITEAARRLGSPDIAAMLAAELESRLAGAGYTVVRLPTLKQKVRTDIDLGSLPFPPKDDVDAVLVVSMRTVGFWAESFVSDYRPEIRAVVVLAASDTRSALYAETLAYGIDYPTSQALLLAPDAKYSYADFDALVRNARQAFEGLRNGAPIIASRVAAGLDVPEAPRVVLARNDAAPKTRPSAAAGEAYPRTLDGPQTLAHFERHPEIRANPGRLAFTLTLLPGGKVERVCDSCPRTVGYGTMTPREDNGLVCFEWQTITYPDSGCFRLVQTGPTRFELRGASGERRIRYSVDADAR